jgi:hypothetical protein
MSRPDYRTLDVIRTHVLSSGKGHRKEQRIKSIPRPQNLIHTSLVGRVIQSLSHTDTETRSHEDDTVSRVIALQQYSGIIYVHI